MKQTMLNFRLSTAHKMKFTIKDFFSKNNQIRRKLRIWSLLRKKSLMENFIFRTVERLINFLEIFEVFPQTSNIER